MGKKNGKTFKVRRKLTASRKIHPKTGAIKFIPTKLYEIWKGKDRVASFKKPHTARTLRKFLNEVNPATAQAVIDGIRAALPRGQGTTMVETAQRQRHRFGE